jgi:phosphatidylglycerol lysyltransferase
MTALPIEARIALLRQFGSFSQAYSAAVQPALSHFGDERGFIAYKKVWVTALALADPVAPTERHTALIDQFVKQHPDTVFCQVSRAAAEVLANRGFFINEMGPDLWIDLASYDFSGKDKQNLRSAANRAAKRGCLIRECSLAELDVKEVTGLCDKWRSDHTVAKREVEFLNRPIVLADEIDVRKFFMFDHDGKLMALGVFDPIYEAGQIVGYIAQHRRAHPDADSLANNAIIYHAIKLFQQEGTRRLFLGLAPFAEIEDRDFQPNKNWLVRRAFRFAFTNPLFNRFVYPLQGIDAHKRQFRGVGEQTYFAFNTLPSLPRVLKLLRACKIF